LPGGRRHPRQFTRRDGTARVADAETIEPGCRRDHPVVVGDARATPDANGLAGPGRYSVPS
jgi:hypothetical protein